MVIALSINCEDNKLAVESLARLEGRDVDLIPKLSPGIQAGRMTSTFCLYSLSMRCNVQQTSRVHDPRLHDRRMMARRHAAVVRHFFCVIDSVRTLSGFVNYVRLHQDSVEMAESFQQKVVKKFLNFSLTYSTSGTTIVIIYSTSGIQGDERICSKAEFLVS